MPNFQRQHDKILVYAKKPGMHKFEVLLMPLTGGTNRRWRGHKSKVEFVDGVRQVTQMTDEESPGTPMDDVWDIPVVNSQALERVEYATQKPEELLERIMEASSEPSNLLADLFCGSGTTLAVAEKLGRRWIGCDLSRYAIHTTRKRLLDIPDCRPFEILNLGRYERQVWQGVTFGKQKRPQQMLVFEYLKFILELYGAQPLAGTQHLHGKRGSAMVHVGAVDAPVTIDEINACITECGQMKQKELHVLGWEWEMGLANLMVEEARGQGVKLLLLTIPREVMEEQAVDKGDIHFYELAYLEAEVRPARKARSYTVELQDFVIPNAELVPPEWANRWGIKIILRGDSAAPDPGGNLFVVNIQQIYESREEEWTPANAVEAILGRPAAQDLASHQPSMLERIKRLNNLAVLNDEAHHVHDDDLAWNQTLQALHDNLQRRTGHGLSLWLDFSATPKTQAGTYYPWIITDYPLAQAIEDQIVKAPLIVHQVKKRDPGKVTRENVVKAYHDWIVVALERWKAHTRVYGSVGQKPVLFIMAERTVYADAIAEHIRKHAGLKKGEVLVIHTDSKGDITQKDLDEAREAARDVDKPDNEVKVIVSVLMLREGWDVKNVTVILGLRPFTAKAGILPEQSVGRGLRLMPNISPDSRQTLEVIGTAAFEDFVRELEQEGVGIDTVGEAPPLPIKIYPVQERAAYDIAIPLTKPRYTHEYRNLHELDPLALPPIYDAGVLAEELAIEIRINFATTDTRVHQEVLMPGRPLLGQDFLREITQAIESRLNLSGHFAELYAIVKRYLQHRCFGTQVGLEIQDVKRRLRDPEVQDGVATFLSREIARLSTQQRTIEFEEAGFHLAQTPPFTWRRQHLRCTKTIFNECAVYNDLEADFARFLDAAPDVLRFAALAESYTRFRVDYLSSTGAIRLYYPDFVAVQETPAGEVNWIIETKGRPFEEVEHKDASIREWCVKISAQTGQTWCYLKVPQAWFDKYEGEMLGGLAEYVEINERAEAQLL